LPGRFDSHPCSTKLNPPSMADCPSFLQYSANLKGEEGQNQKLSSWVLFAFMIFIISALEFLPL